MDRQNDPLYLKSKELWNQYSKGKLTLDEFTKEIEKLQGIDNKLDFSEYDSLVDKFDGEIISNE